MNLQKEIRYIEFTLKKIFEKNKISKYDVVIAKKLLSKWQKLTKYQEDCEYPILNDIIDKNEQFGYSEQDADTFLEYVNRLSELKSSFDIELGDFARAANWGMYQGKPVIIDVGFNSNVLNQYYK
jgi:hypothetical protein